ncbi:hypothetical protein HUO13_24010 [Saccharopolyspora erythraea]|uniref:hypothetical protein n=1 Tax=Saccharopolyspora erythraea TaxID=1836 RepID=UPI001BA4821C|nr:hypothetical protein [Saccharopolyspora erythraea]QUH03476.1 hypothetical protein HUO13_24010 [Saccharopolyspora erythraea]
MSDVTPEPNTEQITVWRNLLDAFAQLSSAWDTAAEVQEQAAEDQGPGTTRMPAELVTAFFNAGTRGAEALTGVANVLADQPDVQAEAVADAQRRAHGAWQEARKAFSGDAESQSES